jgi:hypothetical protein
MLSVDKKLLTDDDNPKTEEAYTTTCLHVVKTNELIRISAFV